MADLLFGNPADWSDADGTSPPACWDGTNYVIVKGSPQTLTYNGTVNYLDTINLIAVWTDGYAGQSGEILSVNGASGYFGGVSSDNKVSGSGSLKLTFGAGETGISLSAGQTGENTLNITLLPYVPVAPDLHMTVAANSTDNTITPAITLGGSPVTPSNLLVYAFGLPTHGTAAPSSFSDTSDLLSYTPTAGYSGPDSFAYYAYVDGIPSNRATVTVDVLPPVVEDCNYNCDCDDASGNRTLKSLRDDLARRLGYGAQVNNLPPGMTDLLNSFLEGAQRALYRRYDVLRTERFYTWNMTTGTRYYDLADNRDTCTRKLDPRKITWAGVSQGCHDWTELRCGINPLLYSHDMTGRPSHYEIRQCIEIWPAPADDGYQLRLKGHFGLDPFAADTDTTTVDDELVFLLALANAKAHYGKPDANNYIQQLETMVMNLVAGAHQTRRYVPGRDRRGDYVYTRPVPTEPFDP